MGDTRTASRGCRDSAGHGGGRAADGRVGAAVLVRQAVPDAVRRAGGQRQDGLVPVLPRRGRRPRRRGVLRLRRTPTQVVVSSTADRTSAATPARRWTIRTAVRTPGALASSSTTSAALGYGDSIPQDGRGPGPADGVPRPRVRAGARWTVLVGTRYGPYAGHVQPSTITWSDCDDDNDYVRRQDPRQLRRPRNPDQSDLDGDRTGDACDPDDDNDGVADASDNCPRRRQRRPGRLGRRPRRQRVRQHPGHGAGDAYHHDDPDAAHDHRRPHPTPPPRHTTRLHRRLRLRPYGRPASPSRGRHRLVGTVESAAVGCRSDVPVTIWRKRSGEDRKLIVVTTRATGKFRTKAPRACRSLLRQRRVGRRARSAASGTSRVGAGQATLTGPGVTHGRHLVRGVLRMRAMSRGIRDMAALAAAIV